MYENLNRLVILAEVADAGSLSEAARRLRLVKSSVSHHMAELEREAGTRLLTRSGRGVAPTPAGEALAAHGRVIAREAREAAITAREMEEPRGRLRVSMPAGIADALVVPVLSGFLSAYPGIRLDVLATDTLLDIEAQGVDVAFRIGGAEDGRFVVRPLHVGQDIFVASPAYLAAVPTIAGPADLAAHPWIGFAAFGESQAFLVKDGSGPGVEVTVSCRVTTTSGLSIKEWVLAGAGMARMPDFAVTRELAEGRLVRVLPGHTAGRPTLHAIYMPERFRPANVRRLLDFARGYFGSGSTIKT